MHSDLEFWARGPSYTAWSLSKIREEGAHNPEDRVISLCIMTNPHLSVVSFNSVLTSEALQRLLGCSKTMYFLIVSTWNCIIEGRQTCVSLWRSNASSFLKASQHGNPWCPTALWSCVFPGIIRMRIFLSSVHVTPVQYTTDPVDRWLLFLLTFYWLIGVLAKVIDIVLLARHFLNALGAFFQLILINHFMVKGLQWSLSLLTILWINGSVHSLGYMSYSEPPVGAQLRILHSEPPVGYVSYRWLIGGVLSIMRITSVDSLWHMPSMWFIRGVLDHENDFCRQPMACVLHVAHWTCTDTCRRKRPLLGRHWEWGSQGRLLEESFFLVFEGIT